MKGGRAAVCVLIDESGSMWGDNIELAKDSAVLLREALDELPNVDAFFFGHTTYSRGKVLIDEFNDAGKYSVGNLTSQGGNIDSVAIVETAKLVRQRTDAKCLFFIVSDGSPNETNPAQRIREAVKTLAAMDMSIVSVGIDFQTAQLYPVHMDLFGNDLAEMPRKLSVAITKALQSCTERN